MTMNRRATFNCGQDTVHNQAKPLLFAMCVSVAEDTTMTAAFQERVVDD